jgi:dipeptidyl-peptidase-4
MYRDALACRRWLRPDRVPAAVVFLCLSFLVLGGPSGALELTLDQLVAEDPDGRFPEDLEWRPGTMELRYAWDDGAGRGHWLLAAAGGEPRLLVRDADLVVGDGPPKDLAFDPTGRRLLYRTEGDLYVFEIETSTVRRLTETEAEEEEAVFAPDGSRLAFVREADLYLLDLASGEERRVSRDGEPEVVWNGTTDWVYWEEIWGRDSTGSWWSGDSRRLAFYHLDDRHLPVYPLVDHLEQHPEVELQRHPKAGDPLPRVEIRVFDLESGETTTLDTGDDPEAYLARVHWHPDHQRLAVERLNRDQTRLDLLLCSAEDGACTAIHSEEHPTWINLGDEFTFLPDGRFLWSSEKSGWKALYLHDADGAELQRLTPPGIALTGLDDVDAAAGTFVFTGFSTVGLGAAERHVYTGPLEGEGAVRRWTQRAGWNGALVGERGYWLQTWSDANTPPVRVVRRRGGVARNPLPSAPAPFLEDLPRWELLTVRGPEGTRLPARVMKPADFDPERRYPVITFHYGGPASQVVENRWRKGFQRDLWHRMMATRGYVVFSVDNQASTFFGKAGEDLLHRRFGEVELVGQLAGLEYLRTQPWADAKRVGLWGWSGGGSNTLYSLLSRPGAWAAGISGAPVTEWHLYDAIWIERYLDHPDDNPEGYRDSSSLTHADRLKDPLLLIHGTGDDNVHVQNSVQMADALIRAGARFELALYPNVSHSWRTFDTAYRRHLLATMTEFFDRHLGGGKKAAGKAGAAP